MARVRFPAVLIRRPCFGVVAGVDEALMADEEVASSKRLGTNVAHKWLLFGVCSARGRGEVSLGAEETHGLRRRVLPDMPL
jgi:hypothetical protein